MMPHIKVLWDLIFDADDTFWPCNIHYRQVDLLCIQILQDELMLPLDPTSCIVHARQIQRGLLRRRGYYLELYEDAWLELSSQLAARHGRSICRETRNLLYRTAATVKAAKCLVFDRVIDTLKGLRAAGHRLHVLSLGNTDIQMAKFHLNEMTGLFDSIHITQRSKGLTMRLISLNGRSTMMIGDSLHGDVLPAVQLGLAVAWVHNTDPWGHTNKSIDMRRVHKISHIAEVPALLQKLKCSTV